MDNYAFVKENGLEGRMKTAFWNKVHAADKETGKMLAKVQEIDNEMRNEAMKAYYEMRLPYAEEHFKKVEAIDEQIKALHKEREALQEAFRNMESEISHKVSQAQEADTKWADAIKYRSEQWAIVKAVRELEYAKIQAEYLKKIEAKKVSA